MVSFEKSYLRSDVYKQITLLIKFISSGVTGVVIILLVAGTCFDLYLCHLRDKKHICRSIKCTTYTNSDLPTSNDKHIKLNPSDVEAKNGKARTLGDSQNRPDLISLKLAYT